MKTKLLIIVNLALAINVHADSATWNLNPINNDWNTAANWTPNTVPNGPNDVATFGASSITAVSLASPVELNGLVLNPGASAFTFSIFGGSTLTISGTGITNNSGITQNFVNDGTPQSFYGAITFKGSATAGTQTMFTNNGGPPGGAHGLITFNNDASAADATFVGNGGFMYFYDSSTAANATITVNGTSSSDGGFGLLSLGSFAAANATLIATDGHIDGGDISVGFIGQQGSNTARVQLYGKGQLTAASGNIGSLEGDGLVIIQQFENLAIGGNNVRTTFSGKIKGDKPFADPEGKGDSNGVSSIVDNDSPSSPSGAVTKDGSGTLTLTGENTYSNGTTVTSGILLVSNASGSGTGKGAVAVNGGTLGGSGIIAGAVTVGTNTGVQAFLAPSKGMKKPATLTIQGALTLNDDSTYIYKLKTKHAKADEVIANGVTIDSGAKFSFLPSGTTALTVGQVFTVISNTAGTAISGTFHNLSDGEILTINGSNLQADYQGGDGNDLTLTVVP